MALDCGPREQVRAGVRPAVQHPPLLCDDIGLEFLVDGDGCFAFHLGVGVAQVGSALAVVQQAVELQREGTGDAQPAADQNERDHSAGRVGPAGEVVGGLDLGHDVLGKAPVDFLGDRRSVAGEECCGAGQGVVPTVSPDGLQEGVELADAAFLDSGAAGSAVHPGQMAFQQRSVDLGQGVDADSGEELAEAGERVDTGLGSGGTQPRRQP